MRILYCIPTLATGGAERQVSYLAVELKKAGHDVHIASSRGGLNLDRVTSAGIQWHHIGGINNRDPIIFFRLTRLLRRLRPDVVQTILSPMDIMGGAAALVTRTPWVLKESSSALLYPSGLRNMLRSALGRRANGIVSNSEGGDEFWRSVGGARTLCIIPNSVPFDEIALAESELKQKIAWASQDKVVLFAGRLDAGKNVRNLILALDHIASELPFTAVICGDGPDRSRLERLTRELGLADRVVFTGYVTNVWTLMKTAAAFASLSRFEGCPNVVLEAMACGCPLVLSDIREHRAIVKDYGASFVNPEEPEAAASAIKALLTNGTTTRLRAGAAQSKAPNWTIAQTAGMYERVYVDVAGANG